LPSGSNEEVRCWGRYCTADKLKQ